MVNVNDVEDISDYVDREEGKVETRELFQQLDVFKPLFETLKRSRFGRILILTGIIMLLSIFVFVSYLGGVITGIVAMLAILLIMIFLILPLVKIKTIPPMSKGVPLLLGKRIPEFTLSEGLTLTVKYIFEYIPIHIGLINPDLEIEIRDKEYLVLNAKLSFSFNADPDRLLEFLDGGGIHGEERNGDRKGKTKREEGGAGGILDIIDNMLIAVIQETGRTLTYEDIFNLDPKLRNSALKRVTKADDPEMDAIIPDVKYKVPKLGVEISNLVIESPKGDETLETLVKRQVTEKLEQKFEVTETETRMLQVLEVVKALEESGQTVDINGLYLIMTEQKLIEGGYKVTPGLNRLLNSLATIIESGAGIADAIDLFNKFRKGDSK